MSERPGLLRRLDATGAPSLLCRLVLGVVLVSMGLAKTGTLRMVIDKAGLKENAVVARLTDQKEGVIALSDPVGFLKVIREYQMVPGRIYEARNALAAVLPWLEVLCGLLLLAGVAVRGTALFMLVTLIGFTILVTYRAVGIYHDGGVAFCAIKFDCGCGAGEVYICRKIAENTVLCLLTLVALISRTRRFCLLPNLLASRHQYDSASQ